jgi:hypothetical protein
MMNVKNEHHRLILCLLYRSAGDINLNKAIRIYGNKDHHRKAAFNKCIKKIIFMAICNVPIC